MKKRWKAEREMRDDKMEMEKKQTFKRVNTVRIPVLPSFG
jgi:hypothetical protein